MHQYYCNNCLKCSDQEKCVGKDRVRVITEKWKVRMVSWSLLNEKKPLNGHLGT